ncbi:MAG: hypothetical protein M0R75_07030 [Dehalococcoidia bacterium]|nr:hypothetical protein [Dehalococcoidia bacterium]
MTSEATQQHTITSAWDAEAWRVACSCGRVFTALALEEAADHAAQHIRDEALASIRDAVAEYLDAFDDWNELGWGLESRSARFERIQAADDALREMREAWRA